MALIAWSRVMQKGKIKKFGGYMKNNTKMNEIRAIEDKYGLLLFGMALTYLIDVGMRNLTEENLNETIEQITAKAGEENAGAKIITPDFQCAIIQCAGELAKFSIWDLLRYIKKYITVN